MMLELKCFDALFTYAVFIKEMYNFGIESDYELG